MKVHVLLCWLCVALSLHSQVFSPPNPDNTNNPSLPPSLTCHREFSVVLSGRSEVPPNNSTHTGSGWFTVDGNVLNFAVGIDAPFFTPTTAGIYGPAPQGANAPIIFEWHDYVVTPPVDGLPARLNFIGGHTLTLDQLQEITRGLWYVNIASADFPSGELRGQILPDAQNDCDGDGVADIRDKCEDTGVGDIVDQDGCSLDQLCPCSAPWRNHQEYVKCVRRQALRFWRNGRITELERRDIVRRAEQSNCGNPVPGPGPQ